MKKEIDYSAQVQEHSDQEEEEELDDSAGGMDATAADAETRKAAVASLVASTPVPVGVEPISRRWVVRVVMLLVLWAVASLRTSASKNPISVRIVTALSYTRKELEAPSPVAPRLRSLAFGLDGAGAAVLTRVRVTLIGAEDEAGTTTCISVVDLCLSLSETVLWRGKNLLSWMAFKATCMRSSRFLTVDGGRELTASWAHIEGRYRIRMVIVRLLTA